MSCNNIELILRFIGHADELILGQFFFQDFSRDGFNDRFHERGLRFSKVKNYSAPVKVGFSSTGSR